MADLAPLTYGQIIGRFAAIIGDTADAGSNPDVTPMDGTVTFTPMVDGPLQVPTATPPTVIIPTATQAELDANGDLVDAQGNPGIWLVAINGPTIPNGFVYRVSFQLTLGGVDVAMPSFNISVPGGVTQNLAVLVPVAGVPPLEFESAGPITMNVTNNWTTAPTVQVGTGATPPIPFDDAGLYFMEVSPGKYKLYLEDGS